MRRAAPAPLRRTGGRRAGRRIRHAEAAPPVRFAKVHDAYSLTANGEPLLAGARGADGAVVIVRDPRDIAPSLAHHDRCSIDQAIAFMDDGKSAFSESAEAAAHPVQAAAVRLEPPRRELARAIGYSRLSRALRRHAAGRLCRAAPGAGVCRLAGQRRGHPPGGGNSPISPNCRIRNARRDFAKRRAPWRGGRFFRRGEAGAWRDELNEEQVARIEADAWADDAASRLRAVVGGGVGARRVGGAQ